MTGPNTPNAQQTLNAALKRASVLGHIDKVQSLLQQNADPSHHKNESVRAAAKLGHLDVVRLLANDSRVQLDAGRGCALREATKRKHTKLVDFLLARPEVNPMSGLLMAISRGHAQFSQHMLNQTRRDPRANNPTSFEALLAACIDRGRADIAKLVIAAFPDQSVVGRGLAQRVLTNIPHSSAKQIPLLELFLWDLFMHDVDNDAKISRSARQFVKNQVPKIKWLVYTTMVDEAQVAPDVAEMVTQFLFTDQSGYPHTKLITGRFKGDLPKKTFPRGRSSAIETTPSPPLDTTNWWLGS